MPDSDPGMPSTRRRFLTRAGPAIALGLAGCATSPPGSNPPTPELVGRSFRTEKPQCGERRHAADVTFEDTDGGRVVLTGTIAGANTCQIAALGGVALDETALDVTVTTKNKYADDPDTTPVCGQCIVEVDYRGVFRFDGGLPSTVRVFHEGVNPPDGPVTVAER